MRKFREKLKTRFNCSCKTNTLLAFVICNYFVGFSIIGMLSNSIHCVISQGEKTHRKINKEINTGKKHHNSVICLAK